MGGREGKGERWERKSGGEGVISMQLCVTGDKCADSNGGLADVLRHQGLSERVGVKREGGKGEEM